MDKSYRTFQLQTRENAILQRELAIALDDLQEAQERADAISRDIVENQRARDRELRRLMMAAFESEMRDG